MEEKAINNLSAQATTECGLLQQEILKSFVEFRKQRGITESLMERLATKKINAIKNMYGDVRVTHRKFGECVSHFSIDAIADGITLSLKYYVKKIPLNGLSKNDQSVARRYNEYVYSYDCANNVSSEFKTFHPLCGLTGSYSWDYSIDEVLESDFLAKGIMVFDNEIDNPFKIVL